MSDHEHVIDPHPPGSLARGRACHARDLVVVSEQPVAENPPAEQKVDQPGEES